MRDWFSPFLLIAMTLGVAQTAAAANLTLSKSASVSEVATGVEFEYTLGYACASITEDCLDVVLTDSLPTELDTSSAKVTLIPSNDVADASYAEPTATFTFNSPLAAGSTGEVKILVRFDNGSTPNGTLATNQASIQGANTGAAVASNAVDVTALAAPDWTLDKALVSASEPALDQDVTYKLTVDSDAGTGSLDLTDTLLVDTLPAGAVFVDASDAGLYDGGAGTVTWDLGTRSAGSTTKRYLVLRFPSATFQQTDLVTNDAELTGTAVGGLAVGELASLEHGFVTGAPAIGTFNKTGTRSTAKAGDSIRYRIRVTNTGNQLFDELVVTDEIPDQIEVTEIRAGRQDSTSAPFGSGIALDVEYATNLNASLQSAGSFDTSAVNNVAVSSLGLAEGEAITKLVWTFSDVPPNYAMTNTSWSIGFLSNLLATDRQGQAVEIDDVVSNVASYSATVDGVVDTLTGSEGHNVTVTGEIARPRIDKSVISGGTLTPGSTARYQLQLLNLSTATGPLVGPVMADLLDESLEYVDGSWAVVNNTAGLPTPVFEQLDNYQGTGRTLLRWRWDGATAGSMPINTRVRVQFDVRVKEGTPVGTVSNLGHLVGPAYADYNAGSCRQKPTDANDLDGDSDTSEQLCASRANDGNLTITDAASMSSEKTVMGQLDDGYYAFPDSGLTVLGGDLEYRFVVTNSGNVPMTGLVITDVLPHVGDSGVIDLGARESAWSPMLIAPVTPPAGVTVYYSTESNPCRGDMNAANPDPEAQWPMLADGAPSDCVAAGWSSLPPADITQVAALRFDFGELVLNPLDSVEFLLTMQVPLDAPSNGEIAWSSFGYYATRTDNDVTLLPSEPVKVGIAVEAPVPAEIGDYVWIDADEDGTQNEGAAAGLNGVRVELWADDGDGVANTSVDTLVSFHLTSDDPAGNPGQFQFTNLNGGDYFLRFVQPDGYEISDLNAAGATPNDNDSDADPSTGLTAVTTLSNGEIDFGWDMGVYSSTTGAVGNYVWHDRNGDGIQNESVLDGINGIGVNLYLAGDLTTAIATTETADDVNGNPGYYSLRGLAADTAHVLKFVLIDPFDSFTTADAPAASDAEDSDADPVSGQTASFSLAAGEVADDMDAGVQLNSGTQSLGDRVWIDADADGVYEPLEGDSGVDGVRLNLYRDSDGSGDYTPGVDAYYTSTLSFTSGGTGFYAFTQLPPGDFIVQIDPAEFATGGSLEGYAPAVPAADPNDDVDDDQNGSWGPGGGVVSEIVTLSAGGEPEADHNPTLDFGFAVSVDDADLDGVPDEEDEYPTDPERATDVIYPSGGGRAYMAFEDMWPLEGDYDLNDMVIAYRITEVQDAAGAVKDVYFDGEIMARGAGYDSAFGFHFPGTAPEFNGVDPALLDWAEVSISGARNGGMNDTFALSPEDGQSQLTLILFQSAKALSFRNDWDTTCKWTRAPRWFNTDHHCWPDQGAMLELRVTFTEPVSRAMIGEMPYNPFIYPNFARGREVHFAGLPPTDKANTGFFGYRADTTDPSQGRYYLTAENKPWAVNVPVTWKHPLEEVAIENGYPLFDAWAASGFTEHTDWYLYPEDDFLFYIVEPGVFY